MHLSCMIEAGEEIPTPSKIKTVITKLGEGEALTRVVGKLKVNNRS